jgi:hypothetical protein
LTVHLTSVRIVVFDGNKRIELLEYIARPEMLRAGLIKIKVF